MLALVALLSGACALSGRETRPAPLAGSAAGWRIGTTARAALLRAAIGGPGGTSIATRMDRHAEMLRDRLDEADVWRVGEGVAVSFDARTLFVDESSAVLTQNGRFIVHKLADTLMAEGRTMVLVLAHTDASGVAGSRQALTEDRAAAIVEYLHTQGLRLARLESRGRGAAEPIVDAEPAPWTRNRRVEVVVYADNDWQEEARRRP